MCKRHVHALFAVALTNVSLVCCGTLTNVSLFTLITEPCVALSTPVRMLINAPSFAAFFTCRQTQRTIPIERKRIFVCCFLTQLALELVSWAEEFVTQATIVATQVTAIPFSTGDAGKTAT